MLVKLGERPLTERSSGIVFAENRYEGRRYPVFNITPGRSNELRLSYTARTLAERDNIAALIDSGDTLVYRDCYNSILYAIALSKDDTNRGRFSPVGDKAFVDFNVTLLQCDYHEVVSYG